MAQNNTCLDCRYYKAKDIGFLDERCHHPESRNRRSGEPMHPLQIRFAFPACYKWRKKNPLVEWLKTIGRIAVGAK